MLKPLSAVFALGCLTLAAQNLQPRLNCENGGNNHNRLVNHCEMKEQTLGAPGGVMQIDPGTNGGVTVRGWDRPDVWLRARIDAAAESENEARMMVPQIRVHSGAGMIRAEGPQMDNNHNWSVSYEIFVPRNADISAKAHNGGIHIADIRGNIEFEAQNGGVTLQRLAGEVKGHTTNGGLTIELAGDRWDGRGMDVSTTNGGVKLGVPANYSAHIETSTVNGGVKTDFPVTIQGRIDREVKFDVGSGGATIRAVTTNGGVSVNRS